jgi:hypothetical protein
MNRLHSIWYRYCTYLRLAPPGYVGPFRVDAGRKDTPRLDAGRRESPRLDAGHTKPARLVAAFREVAIMHVKTIVPPYPVAHARRRQAGNI